MLNVFSDAVQSKRSFEVQYESSQKSMQRTVENMIKQFKEQNKISG